MQLISLNIWGGLIEKPLLSFFQTHQHIDVFCLQEVYHGATGKISTCENNYSLNIFNQIQACLPKHQGYFRPVVGSHYGLAIFVKKDITVSNEAMVSIHENPDYTGSGPAHGRIMQWITCEHDHQTVSYFNVHGLWNGQGKTDSPERLLQSDNILNAIDTVGTPHILCGDFNLRPDSQSLKKLARNRQDLIDQYGITSTRTHFYPKKERFADYLFVSPSLKVDAFKVLPDAISDHAALWVKIEGI